MKYTTLTLPIFLLGCSAQTPAPVYPELVQCTEERTLQDKANSVYVGLVPVTGVDIFYGDFSHWFQVSLETERNDSLCNKTAVLRQCGLQYDLFQLDLDKIMFRFVDGLPLGSLDGAYVCNIDEQRNYHCKPLSKTGGNTLHEALGILTEIAENHFNNKRNLNYHRDLKLETRLMNTFNDIRINEGY